MKSLLAVALLATLLMSCSRMMSPYQAAQGPQRCGRGSLR